jgi:hypothetical protein
MLSPPPEQVNLMAAGTPRRRNALALGKHPDLAEHGAPYPVLELRFFPVLTSPLS